LNKMKILRVKGVNVVRWQRSHHHISRKKCSISATSSTGSLLDPMVICEGEILVVFDDGCWTTLSGIIVVRFEVFTAVSMKNGVFSDVTPCGSCKNRRFGGT
jgi:hypothetical protein